MSLVDKNRLTSHKLNSFDILRLLGAILVLSGHAFSLAGEEAPRFLSVHIHKIGLYVFFFISGYLVSASWLNQPVFVAFAIKRILRIMPALIVVVFLTVFALGPLLSQDTDYFKRAQTWIYLVRNSMLLTSGELPGVFVGNPKGAIVNGSLWTLPVEALLYVLTPIIVRLRLWMLLPITVVLLVIGSGDLGTSIFVAMASVIPWFLIGAAAYRLNMPPPKWPRIHPSADLSYGIYLTSFPVQQSLVWLFPGIGPLAVIAASLAICVVLAWLSWTYVERPAKRLNAPLLRLAQSVPFLRPWATPKP